MLPLVDVPASPFCLRLLFVGGLLPGVSDAILKLYLCSPHRTRKTFNFLRVAENLGTHQLLKCICLFQASKTNLLINKEESVVKLPFPVFKLFVISLFFYFSQENIQLILNKEQRNFRHYFFLKFSSFKILRLILENLTKYIVQKIHILPAIGEFF